MFCPAKGLAGAATLLLSCLAWGGMQAGDPSPAIVVVANLHSKASLEVANAYLKARKLSAEHLIAIPMPLQETIDRKAFTQQIWNPLRQALLDAKWIEGTLEESTDNEGRQVYLPSTSRLQYLLLCKDVPLRISPQPDLEIPNLPHLKEGQITTAAAVDSELACLVSLNPSLQGWVPNPSYRIKRRQGLDWSQSLCVSRLDGPDTASICRIIRQTIEAEKLPAIPGRAYIDLHPHHPEGNRWLKRCETLLTRFGYPVQVEATEAHWDPNQRYDAPALYFGWYQSQAKGPMVLDHTRIPQGAIAAHIHSFSAATLRDSRNHWVGPLIHKGYSVSFGNVYEPYLELTLRPDLFLEALLDGESVGEAALRANPVLSWQNTQLGDPLYRPFRPKALHALSLEDPLVIDQPYLAILLINRIHQAHPARAAEAAWAFFVKHPSAPMAFHLIDAFQTALNPLQFNQIYDYLCRQAPLEPELHAAYLALYENLSNAQDTVTLHLGSVLKQRLAHGAFPPL
jgi:uncharacterized protein (TIGR03790 family)